MKFVIHHHITVPPHYDLMIERGESLKTWRLQEETFLDFLSGTPVPAVPIPDHRLMYLDYSGPLSCDRGRIEAFDTGSCIMKSENEYIFEGRRIKGRLVFTADAETDGQTTALFSAIREA